MCPKSDIFFSLFVKYFDQSDFFLECSDLQVTRIVLGTLWISPCIYIMSMLL